MRPHNLSSTTLITSKHNLQPLRVLPKPIFNPWEYFQSLFSTPWKYLQRLNRTSLNKAKANIRLLRNQSSSPQPFWWLQIIILNPWEYFQSLSSTPWKYFQRSKYIFGSNKLRFMKFSTQAHYWWTFLFMLSKPNLKPLRVLPKPIFNLIKILPKVYIEFLETKLKPG